MRGRPATGLAPGSPVPGSNRWIIPTVLLFVVLPVGGALFQAFGGDDPSSDAEELRGDRSGSVSLGRSRTPLLPDPAALPETYSIVYVATDTASEKVSITNEEVQVRRPFDARVTVRDGAEIGKGDIRGLRVSRLTKIATRGSDGQWTVFDIPPALATTDVRFGAALDQALADGAIAVRERRRVEGRVCQVFRAGSSLQAGTLTPYQPGSPDFADVCIDEEGLVLEEVWSIDGKRVLRRLAAEVQTDVDLRDDRFAIPADARTVPPSQGGGSARPVDPQSRPPGAFRELPPEAVPEGFELLGRWAVVSPRLDVMRDPTKPADPGSTASTVTVYVRGADVLVVDQGALTGSGTLPTAAATRPANLGPLGQGEAITDFRMNEVRAQSGSDFVRIYGTLPIPLLVEAAHALTVVPGGELRYLDQ